MDEHTVLPAPSSEQKEIIKRFAEGNNLQIMSVAGSGKTTTLLYLCQIAKEQGHLILIVTYNKKLSLETEERVKKLGLEESVRVRTIHSAAGFAYGTTIRDDRSLVQMLTYQIPTTSLIFRFGVIMIDEAQDLRQEYYRFLKQVTNGKRIVIVGDPKQSIYDFNDATPQYLIDCERFFQSPYPWSACRLIQSYRLTPLMGQFIEEHVFGPNTTGCVRFVGSNTRSKNRKVKYFVDSWRLNDLEQLLWKKIKKYGIDNVAILAPSVKAETKTPLNLLLKGSRNGTSVLVRNGIALIRRDNQLEKYNDGAEEKGKLLISTFHSMKGCERECCFVFGVDETYFNYYAKQWTDDKNIPNPLYVALTRAKSEMIVIQDRIQKVDDKQIHVNPLRTLNLPLLPHTCKLNTKFPLQRKSQSFVDMVSRFRTKKETSPTDMIKFRNLTDAMELHDLVEVTKEYNVEAVRDKSALVIPYREDGITHVGQYYGVIVPVLVDNEKNGKCTKYAVDTQQFLKRYIGRRIPKFTEGEDETDLNITYILERLALQRSTELYYNLASVISPDLARKIKTMLNLSAEKNYNELVASLPDIMRGLQPKKGIQDKILGDIEEDILRTFWEGNLCKLLILYDLYQTPEDYPAIKLLNWLDYTFIQECQGLLSKFLAETPATFEVETEIIYRHPLIPVLSHKKFREGPNGVHIVLPTKPNPDLIKYLQSHHMTINGYEVTTENLVPLCHSNIIVTGFIDAVYTDGTLLEIKIRQQDDTDDQLQLATYMAMKRHKKGILYNIVTGKVTHIQLKDPVAFLLALTRNIINWDRKTVPHCEIRYEDNLPKMNDLTILTPNDF